MTLLKSAIEIVRNWWWLLIKGFVLLAAGALVLTRPTEGYHWIKRSIQRCYPE